MPYLAITGGILLIPLSTGHNSPRELWLVLGGIWSSAAQWSHLRLIVAFAFPTQPKVQPSAIVADSIVAARRRRVLPSPQDISTTSLLTILVLWRRMGPGTDRAVPFSGERCQIANSQSVLPGPPGAPSCLFERVRTPPWLPVSGGYYN